MGRAIVRDPSAFLFDEPLSNLDAKLRVQMRLEIKSAPAVELRTTSLYVTHDQVEAMTLADRVVVMNEGIAEQIGAPLDVYRNPATTFVAGFIGSPPMNFLAPEHVAGRVNVPGTAATVGIRPEDLALTPADSGDLSGTVAFCEALGADTLVHVRLADGTIAVIRNEGDPLEPGTTVAISIPPERLQLFDEDGRAILR